MNPIGQVLIFDVSEGVGAINYAQVAAQADGVILRGTEGVLEDSRFRANWIGFKAQGVPLGVYGWHNPSDSAGNNRNQADALAGLLQFTGEYPALGMYGDWESDPKHLGIEPMRQAIWKYISTVEATTEQVLKAYSSAGFWDAQVANSTHGPTDIPRDRDLWVANWRSAPPPYMIWDWSQRYGTDCWRLWQYGRDYIPGAAGTVDFNTFNGSHVQYLAYFNLPYRPPVLGEPPAPDGFPFLGEVTADALNCRALADVNSRDIGTLQKGDEIPIVAQEGDWYKVPRFYVHSNYIRRKS